MGSFASISRRRLLAAGAVGLALPTFLRLPSSMAQAQETATMRLSLTFADQDFTVTLEDNAPARELFAMLPLDLTIDDYSTNEKIAYLPRKLSDDGSARFENEAVGDLCYYAPWGKSRDVPRLLSLVARTDPAWPSGPGRQASAGARRISAPC
uniref:cyclophilin-like fold protein n=1 Tax=Aminobacter niigataensis TaxID=83265 RepID=UPI002852702E|nr:cyclophilin-like fold protein [Aminobacter niigataensis]WMD00179.1 cyclophilin-like fold protein [Aminobacter niigataensis]